jgi:hypothetical protein
MATASKPSVVDFVLDLQNQWIIGIISFFVLSMLFGMSFGYESDWPFTVGWIVCGVFALIFITQAFPDVWNYAFWLVGIYGLASAGIFSILVFEPQYGTIISILGALSEITAIGLGFYMILHFKSMRDEVLGIKGKKVDSYEMFKDSRYVPLGFWSMSIMTFWLVSNVSIWGWYLWATNESSIATYFLMELLILFLGLYILWMPQTNFRWSADTMDTTTFARPLKSVVIKRIPKTLIKSETKHISNCPVCGYGLNKEIRSCSHCGESRLFYWCPRSEVFIKRCESCNKPVSFNADECPYCNNLIKPKVTCSKCDRNTRIRDWKLA